MRIIADNGITLGTCWPELANKGRELSSPPQWAVPFLPGGHEEVPVMDASLDISQSTGVEFCLVTGQSAGSQYDLLREPAPETHALPDRLACLALGGKGFHGQHGRPWQVCPGNLHLSMRVTIDLPAAEFSSPLVMLPAVAVCETIDAVYGCGSHSAGPPGIKWINDILLGEKKVAGVLTATRSVAGILTSVVFGVGLNIATRPEFPGSLWTHRPTSLADSYAGPTPHLGPLLESLLQSMSGYLDSLKKDGPGPIVEAYRARSLALGKEVHLWLSPESASDSSPAPDFKDTVVAVNADLSLQLENHLKPVSPARLYIPESSFS